MQIRNIFTGASKNIFYCLIAIGIITIPSACTTSLLTSKLLDVALKPKNTSKDTAAAWKAEIEKYPMVGTWRDSLIKAGAIRDTFITDAEGINLHALYVYAAKPTASTAVVVHGHTSSSVGVAHLGYMYNRNLDMNILLPDLRLSGLSGGENYTMGWSERKEVEQWINVASDVFGDSARIVVHGVSMGAATVMMLSGDTVSRNVACFVEDCGYSSVWNEFKHVLQKNYKISATSLLKSASNKAKKLYNYDFSKSSSVEQVKKSSLPMLFIHGDADSYVPTKMVYELYEAKPEPKELWIVPGAAHDESYKINPDEYTERIKDFITKYGVIQHED